MSVARVNRPAIAIALLLALIGAVVAAPPVRHPMDPISELEYAGIINVLKQEERVDRDSRYPLITLHEPPKAVVSRWQPGVKLPRQAFVIVKNQRQTFEAIVDLDEGRVIRWSPVEGVEPSLLLMEEWRAAVNAVRGHAGWQEAVRARGIEDFEDVICVPLTAGYYGLGEEEGRRLVKVACYDSFGTSNYWGHPIEGLTAIVDLGERQVVEIIDTGPVPIPDTMAELGRESVGKLRTPPNPIAVVQSRGPSFRVEGRQVRWQKWRFHFRIDPRLGPVISMVRYLDGEAERSILYEASLSEMFVPYMDPDVGWYFRTYLDAGEIGVGKLAAPLEPGLDCPSHAMLFDAVFADEWGVPYTQKRAACLFERYAGEIAWRHYEAVNGRSEVRRRVDLVLRFVSAVGNYDYMFDWVFRQDGTIQVVVGASGVGQVKAVRSRTATEDERGADAADGRRVAEHTVAVNHDHFFSFRIDLDVDGPRNSFVHESLRPRRVGGGNPRKSRWVVEPRVAATEQAGRLRIDLDEPALWRLINPNVIGPLGYPVSYQLKPGTNAVSLLSPDDFPQRRAGFTDYHLWVTPYDPDERYAAGTYPNQSRGGDGLPRWTASDRNIQNTDVVLWYTLGFHHVVRAEDWPVLPTTRSEFELRPFDFFQYNPALDLPE